MIKTSISILFLIFFGMPLGLINGLYAYLKILPFLVKQGIYYTLINPFIQLICIPIIHYFIVSPQKQPILNNIPLILKIFIYLTCILLSPGYLLFVFGLLIYSVVYGLSCVWDIEDLFEVSFILIKIIDRCQQLRYEIYNLKDVPRFDIEEYEKISFEPGKIFHFLISCCFATICIPYIICVSTFIFLINLPYTLIIVNYRILIIDNIVLMLLFLFFINCSFLLLYTSICISYTFLILPSIIVRRFHWYGSKNMINFLAFEIPAKIDNSFEKLIYF